MQISSHQFYIAHISHYLVLESQYLPQLLQTNTKSLYISNTKLMKSAYPFKLSFIGLVSILFTTTVSKKLFYPVLNKVSIPEAVLIIIK